MGMDSSAIDYNALEKERSVEIQDELRKRLKERNYGSGGLSSIVLKYVTDQSYDMAVDEMEAYVDSKYDYPQFQDRARQYLGHCTDLINAIKTKRDFPSLGIMSLSKQQELYDRVLEHYEELKHYLKHIEHMERDYKLRDVRSTAWVVKTFMNSVIFVFLFAMVTELVGLGSAFNVVVNKIISDFSDLIVGLF